MLVATSEARIGSAAMRSTLVLERRVRATIVRRESLVFDTRFAAAAAGKAEAVGHVFLLLHGRLVPEGGAPLTAPVGLVIADPEIERVGPRSRTFRTDGDRVELVQMRIDREHVRVPIGLDHGALRLSPAVWDAAAATAEQPTRLAGLLDTLASAGVIAPLSQTIIAEEPERFRRLWEALKPLYAEYGATASLKQLASSLGMSMRQVGRDAKEMSEAFGLGSGYRDTLLVLRLRVAVLLLGAPGATVQEVAQQVGYGSAIAMARAFRDAKLPAPSAIQAALQGK